MILRQKVVHVAKPVNAEDIIALLNLRLLPEEGGYFREVYRAHGKIPGKALPDHSGDRNYCTAIYYLITSTEFSGLHRVRSDEIFHFYAGDPVEMVQITAEGELRKILIGSSLSDGTEPQVIVPAGVWQGACLVDGGAWALLGCTVAPGFEFEDFEAGTFLKLSSLFPQHADTIRRYTRR